MAIQILAYLIIIVIAAISEITMTHIAEDCMKSYKTIYNILGVILDLLCIVASIIIVIFTIKCLSLCFSIIL